MAEAGWEELGRLRSSSGSQPQRFFFNAVFHNSANTQLWPAAAAVAAGITTREPAAARRPANAGPPAKVCPANFIRNPVLSH